MDAANASIQKYFVDDLSDLIDCMDFGFHQVCSLIIFFLISNFPPKLSFSRDFQKFLYIDSSQITMSYFGLIDEITSYIFWTCFKLGSSLQLQNLFETWEKHIARLIKFIYSEKATKFCEMFT